MSSSINKSVNVERRTWDKETFEARAQSRAAAEGEAAADASGAAAPGVPGAAGDGAVATLKNDIEPSDAKEEFLPAQQGREGPLGSQRAFLKSRSRKVDLESKLGSSEIIDPAAVSVTKKLTDGVTKSTDGVGWHCRVCDCFLKDSLTYLDHINGRKHQRHLGYTMRAEKSTTAEVGGLLKGLAEKRARESGAHLGAAAAVDFEDTVRQKDAEALRRKAERARRREERKRRGKEGATGAGPLHVVADSSTVEEKPTGDGNPAEEEAGEEEEEEGIDPNLAAMMGFSGFGGSRK